MHGRAERLARGWIVGAFATTTAALSHALAGGYSPNALSLGVALVFSGMLGTLAIGRRPSLPRLAIIVAVGQLAFHLLFSMLGSGHGGGGTTMSMADMRMPAVRPVLDAPSHTADPRMWLAHAVAAILTIAFLQRAERGLWTLLHRALRFVLRAALVAVAPAPAGSPRVAAQPPVLVSPRVVAAVSRRGPPFLVSL